MNGDEPKKRPAYAGLEGVNTEKFNAGELGTPHGFALCHAAKNLVPILEATG
ncbi:MULTISPECIES: hypothetical protein [unclassified Janthinobacterium]|uniref:hypothetical protein n=1 Tax=unclassified Janthinobacterium TaxID=2610881 RepID=UPI0016196CB7|nr:MULTISPECIES: hypothetical protein [unclassified Janthinobacterium]MBB5610292.1 hypothetical protein [Janthinobacterium sp. S3T4]MBB5615689.1 hypothetical protein [Janthinobacterium sp. S3M3]